MPSCFQLTRKGDNQPSKLIDVDNAICQYLGVNAHEHNYACHWYDVIGLLLAVGRTFDEIIDSMWKAEDYTLLRIAAFLNEHYDSHSWKEWR